MAASLWLVLLSLAVAVSVLVQLFAPGSGMIAVVTGLLLVLGGTLLTAVMSHSQQAIFALWRHVADIRPA